MRNPFLFLMSLFTVATLATSAQIQPPEKTWPQLMPFREVGAVVLHVKPAADSTDPRLLFHKSTYNNKWYREGGLVDSVSMGKVYRMPFDKMLCLVPDDTKNSRMPVQTYRAPERMPNAYRRPGRNR